MKRFCLVLALLVLIGSLALTAFAAGYGSLSGPSTVRAGDTITLSYGIGGGVFGANGTLSYDSSQLTLQGTNSAAPGGWIGEFNGNTFVFYDNSMSNPIQGSTIFTATFTVNPGLTPGTAISVNVSGTVSDGNADSGAGGSWSATIAPPLSGNCDLASLTVSGANISPVFSAGVTSYSASVPFTTSAVQVSATAADGKAKVSVNNPGLVAGGTTNISVTVTAENGATKTYTIRVARAQDPNYVPSNNNKLESLTVEGQILSPVFSPDVTHYYIWLPYETETVSVSGKSQDNKASVSVGEIPALEPGKGTDIAITVTAEDKSQLVYTITAVRAPAHEDVEAFLNGERPQETEPVTEPTEPVLPEEPAAKPVNLAAIITGVICLLAGAGIGVLVLMMIQKKKFAVVLAETESKEQENPDEESDSV